MVYCDADKLGCADCEQGRQQPSSRNSTGAEGVDVTDERTKRTIGQAALWDVLH